MGLDQWPVLQNPGQQLEVGVKRALLPGFLPAPPATRHQHRMQLFSLQTNCTSSQFGSNVLLGG